MRSSSSQPLHQNTRSLWGLALGHVRVMQRRLTPSTATSPGTKTVSSTRSPPRQTERLFDECGSPTT